MMELASIAGKYFEYADLVESIIKKIDVLPEQHIIAEAAPQKTNDFKQNQLKKRL